jgi:acyl-CoA thioester hydrolase
VSDLRPLDGYACVVPVVVRWRDLDPLGHVNNAVIASYFEMARLAVLQEHFPVATPQEVSFVIARLSIDFRRPIRITDEVRIGVRVGRLGSSSYTFEYRVEASGELAALGETVQVHLDEGRSRPAPLPAELRQRLAGLQEPS